MNLSRFLHLRLQGAPIDTSVFNGGGGGQPSSTTTVQQNFSPEEAARRTQVMDEAKRIYDSQRGMWNSMVNPASKPVPASANTIQAQNMVKEAATGAGQQLANNASHAANFGLSGDVLDPNRNPGFQGALNTAVRRVGEAYTDPGGVLSNIRSNFMQSAPSGQSSREAIAMGLAGRSFLNTVGDVTSDMTSKAYGQGLDFMKSSMAFAPNMYNLQVQPGISVGAVGQQQEAYLQAQEDAAASDRAWQLQAPWAGLQPYASMVTGMANPSTVTNAQGAASRGPGAMGILGGAAMGAYIGSVVPGIGTAVGAGVGALAGMLAM